MKLLQSACFATLISFFAVCHATSSLYTNGICLTLQSTKPTSPVPTTKATFTKSYSYTGTITKYSTSTVTPKPVSKTSTVFVTSTLTTTVVVTSGVLTSTATSFTTSTAFETATVTTTATETTTTTTASTTTIATSSGFVPLQSYIANRGLTPAKEKKRHELLNEEAAIQPVPEKRHILAVDRIVARGPTTTSSKVNCLTQTYYPSKVYCLTKVDVVNTVSTVTTTKGRTTTAAPITSVSTTTVTLSQTSTVASTTASSTSVVTTTSSVFITSTSTVTSTSTTTITETAAGAIVTVNAVCQQNNYLQSVNGRLISGVSPQGSFASGPAVTSIDECCNACANAGASCATGLYFQGVCYFLSQRDGTCSVGGVGAIFNTDSTPRFVSTLFNTNCGQDLYDA